MFVGFYTGLIPRKPQNPSIFGTLTASRHLIYGKNLKIKIWNIFSNHIDHFKGVPKKSLNYSPPLLMACSKCMRNFFVLHISFSISGKQNTFK